MEPDTFRELKPGRTSKRTGRGGEETPEEMLFPSLSASQEVTDTISRLAAQSAHHAPTLRPAQSGRSSPLGQPSQSQQLLAFVAAPALTVWGPPYSRRRCHVQALLRAVLPDPPLPVGPLGALDQPRVKGAPSAPVSRSPQCPALDSQGCFPCFPGKEVPSTDKRRRGCCCPDAGQHKNRRPVLEPLTNPWHRRGPHGLKIQPGS